MENFSERLRKRMAILGLKAPDVARKMGINSRQTVSSWTTGRAKPHADDLLRLAEALETSVDWLLSGKKTPVQYSQNDDNDSILIAKEEYIDYLSWKNKKLEDENQKLKELNEKL